MNKQELVYTRARPLLYDKKCHAAAKCLELQCSLEYWCDIEGGYRATAIHRLRPKNSKLTNRKPSG